MDEWDDEDAVRSACLVTGSLPRVHVLQVSEGGREGEDDEYSLLPHAIGPHFGHIPSSLTQLAPTTGIFPPDERGTACTMKLVRGLYSHDGPIRRRKRRHILPMDQSDLL
eukprot:3099904-Pyramimonas_sp.AAC.1